MEPFSKGFSSKWRLEICASLRKIPQSPSYTTKLASQPSALPNVIRKFIHHQHNQVHTALVMDAMELSSPVKSGWIRMDCSVLAIISQSSKKPNPAWNSHTAECIASHLFLLKMTGHTVSGSQVGSVYLFQQFKNMSDNETRIRFKPAPEGEASKSYFRKQS